MGLSLLIYWTFYFLSTFSAFSELLAKKGAKHIFTPFFLLVPVPTSERFHFPVIYHCNWSYTITKWIQFKTSLFTKTAVAVQYDQDCKGDNSFDEKSLVIACQIYVIGLHIYFFLYENVYEYTPLLINSTQKIFHA